MFNWLKPKIIEELDSHINGKIRVMQGDGYKYVAVGNLTQSGGLIRDIWGPVLGKLSKNKELTTKNWLILGLAAGTAAQIISDKYSPAKIVGVEIDPQMLDIGRRYFDLDKIPNLEIINADARNFISESKDRFDYILIDMYVGDTPPQFLYSKNFLDQLGQLGELVIINHLFYDIPKKAQAEKLIKNLASSFKNIQLRHSLSNILIICS